MTLTSFPTTAQKSVERTEKVRWASELGASGHSSDPLQNILLEVRYIEIYINILTQIYREDLIHIGRLGEGGERAVERVRGKGRGEERERETEREREQKCKSTCKQLESQQYRNQSTGSYWWE